MHARSRVFVAGHRGLVGSAICRHLQGLGYSNLLVCGREQLDLAQTTAVDDWFRQQQPEFVILAAAKVGGILANTTRPVDFLAENLKIQQNVIEASYKAGVSRLLFLGSSCIYPKACPQPIKEEYLLTGELEPTNRPYAIAKIAGIELCWAYNRQHGAQFLAAMPTNLYGPEDNFDPQTSHVLPALIRRVAEAKAAQGETIDVWGTGTPRREFMYSDDCAEACVFLMSLPEAQFASLIRPGAPPLINIGTGEDLPIRELAEMIAGELGYSGKIVFDPTKPDGTPRKLLDVRCLSNLGWTYKITLREGVARTCAAYQSQYLVPPT